MQLTNFSITVDRSDRTQHYKTMKEDYIPTRIMSFQTFRQIANNINFRETERMQNKSHAAAQIRMNGIDFQRRCPHEAT